MTWGKYVGQAVDGKSGIGRGGEKKGKERDRKVTWGKGNGRSSFWCGNETKDLEKGAIKEKDEKMQRKKEGEI